MVTIISLLKMYECLLQKRLEFINSQLAIDLLRLEADVMLVDFMILDYGSDLFGI
jgi:hypothetical protein